MNVTANNPDYEFTANTNKPETACLDIGMKVARKETPMKLLGTIRNFESFGICMCAHVLQPGYRFSATVENYQDLVPFKP